MELPFLGPRLTPSGGKRKGRRMVKSAAPTSSQPASLEELLGEVHVDHAADEIVAGVDRRIAGSWVGGAAGCRDLRRVAVGDVAGAKGQLPVSLFRRVL